MVRSVSTSSGPMQALESLSPNFTPIFWIPLMATHTPSNVLTPYATLSYTTTEAYILTWILDAFVRWTHSSSIPLSCQRPFPSVFQTTSCFLRRATSSWSKRSTISSSSTIPGYSTIQQSCFPRVPCSYLRSMDYTQHPTQTQPFKTYGYYPNHCMEKMPERMKPLIPSFPISTGVAGTPMTLHLLAFWGTGARHLCGLASLSSSLDSSDCHPNPVGGLHGVTTSSCPGSLALDVGTCISANHHSRHQEHQPSFLHPALKASHPLTQSSQSFICLSRVITLLHQTGWDTLTRTRMLAVSKAPLSRHSDV